MLHAGSAKAGEVGPAIERAGKVIKAALADTDRCPLHLENTAGTGGTLGRSFAELAALLDAAGGGKRLGVCLDSCHLLASGYDVRDRDAVAATVGAFDEEVGLDRLHSLHVNDSKMPLGSNRDRHAAARARARSARRAAPRSCPSPLSTACPPSSRARAWRARTSSSRTSGACASCASAASPPAEALATRGTAAPPEKGVRQRRQ